MPEHSINSEIAHELHKKQADGHGGKRNGRLEMFEALLLAAVAIATAWSGYQAARWDGRSAESYAHATDRRVDGDNAVTLGGEQLLEDMATFNTWLLAKANGRDDLSALLERRFSADYEPAFRAWLATEPFTNSNSPAGPAFMAEYKNHLEIKGAEMRQTAVDLMKQGHEERETAEDYVRHAVFLATVLFLIAMAQRFSGRSAQLVLLAVAGTATLVILVMLATYPLG